MIHRYIIEVTDEVKGFEKAIEKLDREWGIEELEPCEDAISREAVEKITWEEPSYTDALNVLTEVREKIRQLPSVTPQPNIGKWMRSWCEWQQYLKCSKCGYETGLRCDTNYCPNCGAKMEVEEE